MKSRRFSFSLQQIKQRSQVVLRVSTVMYMIGGAEKDEEFDNLPIYTICSYFFS